jgi:hypothetical protein
MKVKAVENEGIVMRALARFRITGSSPHHELRQISFQQNAKTGTRHAEPKPIPNRFFLVNAKCKKPVHTVRPSNVYEITLPHA